MPLLLHYAHFLLGVADVANVRAMLEAALPGFEPKEARPLWDLYVTVEARFGSASSLRAVESRRAAALPELGALALFNCAASHAFEGVWPAAGAELRELQEADGEALGPSRPHLRAKQPTHGGAAAVSLPNLAACIEYTGLPVPAPYEEAPLPPQLAAMLTALPAAAGLAPPSASDVELICAPPTPPTPRALACTPQLVRRVGVC